MKINPTYKMFVFDLDETLAESKQAMEPKTASLLSQLVEKHPVAIITGGKLEQIEKQVLPFLSPTALKSGHFYLLPTSGASLYSVNNTKLKQLYNNDLTTEEELSIRTALKEALETTGIQLDNTFEECYEFRGSQCTLSCAGQTATSEEKRVFDPTLEKRKAIIDFVKPNFPELNIVIGGISSIDITKKGIDKGFGITELSKITRIPVGEMLCIGNRVSLGGNDYGMYLAGGVCKNIRDIKHTESIIQDILTNTFTNHFEVSEESTDTSHRTSAKIIVTDDHSLDTLESELLSTYSGDIYMTSMVANPLHGNHVAMIRDSIEIARRNSKGKFMVVVDGDAARIKKSGVIHMDAQTVAEVVAQIPGVDLVMIYNGEAAGGVNKVLETGLVGNFLKGGDRKIDTIPEPERDAIERLGMTFYYNVGPDKHEGTDKEVSSSAIRRNTYDQVIKHMKSSNKELSIEDITQALPGQKA